MKKFEYKIAVLTQFELHTDIGKIPGSDWEFTSDKPKNIPFANKLGDDGWELVGMFKEQARYFFTFKREKQ
jgi:hypothetical protein